MRFHVLGLDHLPTLYEITSCAFTQKNLKLLKMLLSKGHDVIFYCAEGSERNIRFGNSAEANTHGNLELVEAASKQLCIETYGEYDWKKEHFRTAPLDGKANKSRETFNRNCIEHINSIKKDDDFLLCTQGTWHKPIASEVNLKLTCESGIGYRGVFADIRVFESYAWMHTIYGIFAGSGNNKFEDGQWWDAVIPNAFEIDEFPFVQTPGRTKPLEQNGETYEDYYLYIGRITQRKGVELVIQLAEQTGKKIIVAGQGGIEQDLFRTSVPENLISLGAVGAEDRATLMGNAHAVLMPTYYIEPFGGVNVEAQLCGTPVITTDWGVFNETVQHGVTGYRCRIFEEFKFAMELAKGLDRKKIRQWAQTNYSTERIADMYDHYFNMLHCYSQEGGWYTKKDMTDLDWLIRHY